MAEFAVIIPSYNAAGMLLELLNSLAVQTSPGFDVIVIDDASTDNTAEVVAMFDVRYERLEANSGPAAARNYGASLTDADWLVFADSDTVFQPDTMASIRDVLERSHADALMGTYSGTPANEGFVPRYKGLWEQATIDMALPCDERGLSPIRTWAPRPGIVRREAFEAMGGFNTRFRGADLEDMEFGYRLSKAGYQIYFAPQLRILHNYPATAMRELKAFARRSALWIRIQRSRKEFDTAGEGSRDSARAHLIGFAALWFAVAAIAIPLAWPLFALLMAEYARLNRRFLGLALREVGLFFTIRSFLYCWVHTIVLGFSAAYGLVTPSREY